jgi:hypothetical protein
MGGIAMKTKQITIVPNDYVDNFLPKVSPEATAVFLVVCSYVGAWPRRARELSVRRLPELTGMTKRKIEKAINDLVEADAIKILRYEWPTGKVDYCLEVNYTDPDEEEAINE